MGGVQLAIFDVDGTLTRSSEVDAACFATALSEELGSYAFPGDVDFRHVTDIGILRQVFHGQLGRLPTDDEVSRVRSRFLRHLAASLRRSPEACTEVPGAMHTLARLQQEPGWAVAIATGCWRESALRKLGSAGIRIDALPAAFAEDGLARPDVVTAAIAKAQARYGHLTRIVSIGDGAWDVQTAAHLQVAFLGVRYDGDHGRLHRRGATHVVSDFTDFDALLQALASAGVPAPPSDPPAR